MDSTENLIGEILFAWLHTICTPLLFLGPFHPGTPGFTHEGLRSYGRGQFPRDCGSRTLLRPAKGRFQSRLLAYRRDKQD